MKSAKFHLIGEDSDWYKIRVQKEIEAQGLLGNVLDAGEGKLVIFVEGEEERINRMYESLKEASPKKVLFTLLEYGRTKETRTRKGDDKWNEVLELLYEIEKNTRRINQKLNALSEKEVVYAEEDKEKEAESAFAFMFG